MDLSLSFAPAIAVVIFSDSPRRRHWPSPSCSWRATVTVPRTEGLGQRLSRLLVILACALSGGLLAGYAGAAIAAILAILGYEGLSRPIRAALLRSYLKSPPASGKRPSASPCPGRWPSWAFA
jgi:hypothetical protein